MTATGACPDRGSDRHAVKAYTAFCSARSRPRQLDYFGPGAGQPRLEVFLLRSPRHALTSARRSESRQSFSPLSAPNLHSPRGVLSVFRPPRSTGLAAIIFVTVRTHAPHVRFYIQPSHSFPPPPGRWNSLGSCFGSGFLLPASWGSRDGRASIASAPRRAHRIRCHPVSPGFRSSYRLRARNGSRHLAKPRTWSPGFRAAHARMLLPGFSSPRKRRRRMELPSISANFSSPWTALTGRRKERNMTCRDNRRRPSRANVAEGGEQKERAQAGTATTPGRQATRTGATGGGDEHQPAAPAKRRPRQMKPSLCAQDGDASPPPSSGS